MSRPRTVGPELGRKLFAAEAIRPRGPLALLAIVSLLVVTGCDDESRPPPTAPPISEIDTGGAGPVGPRCESGATRVCRIELPSHNGVASCFEGVQRCEQDGWGPCERAESQSARSSASSGAAGATAGELPRVAPAPDGAVPVIGGPAVEPDAGWTPRSLSQPAACADNPCDPSCRGFDEVPDEPIEGEPGDGGGSWEEGDLGDFPPGLVGKGLDEPCSTAADCQFNRHCDNPQSGSCAHSKCAAGPALGAGCDECVDLVCAADPSCCQQALSCENRFGDAKGFVDCAQTPSQCTFGFNSKKASCAEICSAGGGTCVGAYDNSGTCGVDWGDSLGCDGGGEKSAICICSTPEAGAWDVGCVALVHDECGVFCPEGLTGCAHDPCTEGSSLAAGCDDCVDSICAADPYCCSVGWDALCVTEVAQVCNGSCDSTPPDVGICEPWLPGQTDPDCSGVELTVGVPCDGVIPVCNVGNTAAPAGVRLVHFPANSQQYPSCTPNQGHPQMKTCWTTEPVPPGQCISVTGCPGLGGNREILVNPPGADHVNECHPASCMNNWSLYHAGECHTPSCSGSSSEATLKPVSLYVMFDKSGSMGTNGMWLPAMNALEAFFADPQSAGLAVALRFFPDNEPSAGCDTPSCSANACADALVPLGWLSAAPAPVDAHELALTQAIEAKSPGGYTPTYIALLGAAQWGADRAAAHPEEQVGIVLVSDGEPNRCNPGGNNAIVQIAGDAYDQHGVQTYAIGLDGANMSLMNGIASAGGTTNAFFISNGNQVQAELLAALQAIRGSTADCELPLSNPGNFDPSTASVWYQSGADPAEPLQQVANASACGADWYYDDNANPSRIVLCPQTCATVQADAQARIEVSIACAGAYDPVDYSQTYEASCPAGTWVQWGFLSFDTTVPGDGSVSFSARTADSVAALSGAFTTLATATLASPDCAQTGPAPCPIDVYDALGGAPAARQSVLELAIHVEPTSNGALSPSVEGWQLTYSCPDSE